MSKYIHYESPLHGGNTGTFAKEDGIDPHLISMCILGGIAVKKESPELGKWAREGKLKSVLGCA